MKKQFFRCLSGFVPAMALFTSLNAQSENPNPTPVPGSAALIFNDAKANTAEKNEGTAFNVNARALKNFNKSFKKADNADWSAIKHGFVVKFENNGVGTRVFYDKKGRWSATILTYGQDKLPQDIRKLVRSTYYEYYISQVNEITVEDKTAYLVTIQDQETVKTIRVTDEGMDVYEEFKKE